MKIHMQKLAVLALISLISCFQFGCLGMMARSMSVGDSTWNDLKSTFPPIAKESGRLVVYMPGSGPNIMNTMGASGSIKILDKLFACFGETFAYVDLPAGTHALLPNYGKGFSMKTNAIEITLKAGEALYVRLEKTSNPLTDYVTAAVVEERVATPEIGSLKMTKPFKKR